MMKKIIKNNFSRYSQYYDEYSFVQNKCAQELINKIDRGFLSNILDIGCGTGNYTKLLRKKFPKAKIKAIDISDNMIKVAKEKLPKAKIEFITKDAEKIALEERYDFISSNASFQWFKDLKQVLINYKDSLNEGGIITFSIFGSGTFCELNESLKELLGPDTAITSSKFLSKIDIIRVLTTSFDVFQINTRIYKQKYGSLKELLKSIKYTGTRGTGVEGKNFWTQKKIQKLEAIYKEKFKSITATYEVFFCEGIK